MFTFNDAVKMIKDYQESHDDFPHNFEDLFSDQEFKDLSLEVFTWDKKIIERAEDVLSDYFGIELPKKSLLTILSQDFNLAYETFTDGISDTCCRDRLIDAVTRFFDLSNWPTYGDAAKNPNIEECFKESLKQKIESVGGKVFF